MEIPLFIELSIFDGCDQTRKTQEIAFLSLMDERVKVIEFDGNLVSDENGFYLIKDPLKSIKIPLDKHLIIRSLEELSYNFGRIFDRIFMEWLDDNTVNNLLECDKRDLINSIVSEEQYLLEIQ